MTPAVASPSASASPSAAPAASSAPSAATSGEAPPPLAPALAARPLDAAPTIPATEAELARSQPIARVTVTGNRRIATDEVSSYLRESRTGKEFSPEGLARDVGAMWNSGYFDDIEVDLARRDDGVHLRFLVREKPSVKVIEFEGNSKIDQDDLTEAFGVEV